MVQNKATTKVAPMIIVLNPEPSYMSILNEYVALDYLEDSIAVGGEEVIDAKYWEMREYRKPEGYQDWGKWGADYGHLDQRNGYRKYKEHEL